VYALPMSPWLAFRRRRQTGFRRTSRVGAIAVAVLLSAQRVHADTPPFAGGGAPPPAYPAAPPATQAYPPPPPSAQLPAPPVPTALPPPPAFPTPAAPPSAPGLGGVLVELRSDNPHTRIDVDAGGVTSTACLTPCRRVLARNQIYVIQGDGVRPSSRFMLPDDRAEVTLDVHAGSSSRLMAGALLMGAGFVVSYIGVVVLGTGQTDRSLSDSFDPDRHDRANEELRTGTILLLCGVPTLVVGLYLVLTARTSVVSSSGASFSQENPAPARKRPWHPSFALTPRGLEF
jgi:hypothetical protein